MSVDIYFPRYFCATATATRSRCTSASPVHLHLVAAGLLCLMSLELGYPVGVHLEVDRALQVQSSRAERLKHQLGILLLVLGWSARRLAHAKPVVLGVDVQLPVKQLQEKLFHLVEVGLVVGLDWVSEDVVLVEPFVVGLMTRVVVQIRSHSDRAASVITTARTTVNGTY